MKIKPGKPGKTMLAIVQTLTERDALPKETQGFVAMVIEDAKAYSLQPDDNNELQWKYLADIKNDNK